LTDPDQLPAIEQHLARPDSVEAQQPGPTGRNRFPFVNLNIGFSAGGTQQFRQYLGKTLTQPNHRPVDVIGPSRCSGRQNDVDPNDVTRHEKNRSPSTSAANNLDTRTVAGIKIHRTLVLSRSENKRSTCYLVRPDFGTNGFGNLATMELKGTRARSDEFVPVRRHRSVQRQDASGR